MSQELETDSDQVEFMVVSRFVNLLGHVYLHVLRAAPSRQLQFQSVRSSLDVSQHERVHQRFTEGIVRSQLREHFVMLTQDGISRITL